MISQSVVVVWYLRHSSYLYPIKLFNIDSEKTSLVKGSDLNASTASNKLEVFVEHAENQYTKICSIAPGGAIVLPSTPALGSNQSFHVESSGSETIAVEFAAID